jgi:hypothetical protein
MMARKINVGKGLLRLYLALWMLLAVASLVVGHREVLTYLGSTYWSAESTAQREKVEMEKRKVACKSEDCRQQIRDSYFGDLGKPVSEIGDEMRVKNTVEMWALFVLVVPAVLLIILTALFKLLVWVLVGFKAN